MKEESIGKSLKKAKESLEIVKDIALYEQNKLFFSEQLDLLKEISPIEEINNFGRIEKLQMHIGQCDKNIKEEKGKLAEINEQIQNIKS